MPVRLIDLTQPLGPATPVLPGDPPVETVPRLTHAAGGFAVLSLCLGTHTGTHVDAPFHLLVGGATLDTIPLSRFWGPAVVLDVRRGPTSLLGAEDLQRAEEARAAAAGLRGAARPLSGCRICLLWTGWDEHFGGESMTAHPALSREAALWLLEAGADLVGTDAPSLDPVFGATFPVHETLLGSGVLLVENLTNLGTLGPAPVTCGFFPLPITGGDGSPVRAVAWLEETEGEETRAPGAGRGAP